jgi:uncharacterized membrane protein YozB (DUF420 family)
MKIVAKVLWLLAFLWVLLLSAGTILQYLVFSQNTVFLQIKKEAIQTGWYLPAFYCHIFASSVILIIGFFQFSKRVYNNRPLHKTLGKIYVFGILFFAAPGAYVMTLFVNRGAGVFASFLIQNTLWVACTLAAWLLVMKGNIGDHKKMMRRSYALAFGAVTLRFYIWLFTTFGHGVGFEHNYLIIAFASWVPNLLVAEIINRYEGKLSPSPAGK